MKKSLVSIFTVAILVSSASVSHAFEIYMANFGNATVHFKNGNQLTIPAYRGTWIRLDGRPTRVIKVTDVRASQIDRVCFGGFFGQNEVCTKVRPSDTWAKFQ